MFAQTASVLIVEDEILIAADLEQILVEGGFVVLGPCGSIDEARALLRQTRPDCALLDCDLFGASSAPLARELRESRIPFAFLTGASAPEPAGQEGGDSRVVQKPFAPQDILDLVASFGLGGPGRSSPSGA